METPVEETLTLLTAEQILAVDDIETRTVPVPEWGGAVLMRTMTGKARDEYNEVVQSRLVGKGDNRHISHYRGLTALLLHKCLVKQDGTPLFERKQLVEFQNKNSAVIQRLQKIASEMNGLTNEEVEEIAGNSESDRSDDDGTTSQDDLGVL